MIGGTLNIKHVRAHWDEILRLATSIKAGHGDGLADAPKLGGYPRQNGWPSPCASWDASSARCSSWTGCKRRAAPPRACRAEQGRSAQRAGPRRVLQPPGEIRDPVSSSSATGQRPQLVTVYVIVLWNTVIWSGRERVAWLRRRR